MESQDELPIAHLGVFACHSFPKPTRTANHQAALPFPLHALFVICFICGQIYCFSLLVLAGHYLPFRAPLALVMYGLAPKRIK